MRPYHFALFFAALLAAPPISRGLPARYSPPCPPPPRTQSDKRWTEQWGWVSQAWMRRHRLRHGKWILVRGKR